MCSWCWGFAPALEQLEATYPLPVRTVMGGLRTGPQADEMDQAARDQLARYWDGVAQRTGQRFTHAALERGGWRYDTSRRVERWWPCASSLPTRRCAG